ncbi:uncharacterized protein LOC130998778 [Salvia miltiorrhiza]|uniref:uncharacterized protein LOC130998778 n=1 Tax=Salvia miltiorrhiza TaxID=226208 RepID=UPI0025AC403B|nr:uncharacterized protein LOC130998778 [Salvia miltiorrhiza]
MNLGLESFVVTFWEDSVSDEIYAKLEPISNRIPLLLLNFSVVPYYGLSLTTNAQSIVLDGFENEMLIELERWKQENEEAINILIQTGGFFEKKVLRSPKQPLQITKVEQMLQNQENTYFNVKVKARLENEYQDYFYIGCPICSTKTVASYGTEFMCYSTPCKNMRIANRSFRFSLMVFDASGQVEVTFLGKEAQKLLGLDPSEFYKKQNQGPITQVDFLRQRLCNIVLLLKLKSRIFKDVCTFTADAIEILQDDGAIPSEKSSIEPEAHLEQGLLKSATRQLVFPESLDNDEDILAKDAAKAKGKGKMSQESHVEYIKGENDYDMLFLLDNNYNFG